MKKLGSEILRADAHSEILMGNYALVRAMLESNVRVVTSYPGSPTPEIAQAINAIPREKNPLYFEFSINEKVALEVAFGAAINGHTSCCFFKSVGLNVASDSFVQLPLMNIIGGMIIVLGDDPGANSSQNEQDNRHYARLSYLPVFEPSSAQEAYTMFKAATALAQEKQTAVILRLSTHICHAKEAIEFAALDLEKDYNWPSQFSAKNGPYIPITKAVFPLKQKALERLELLKLELEGSCLHLEENNNASKGIITAGLPYASLKDIQGELQQQVNILRLGIINPLPEQKIIDFLRQNQEVKVLEELDDYLEQKIKALAYDHGLTTKINGKLSIEDWLGEYTPDKVREVLHRTWADLMPLPQTTHLSTLKPRPPQMCPGCGHRSAFYAVKNALKEQDITVADIGCHTLGFLPPYNIGEVLLCMGHSCGTAAGLALNNTQRNVVAFLGDSTLFHAGLPGIINAIYNQHNFTLIIMDNGTTAMTGHQDNAGSGQSFNGETTKIKIKTMLESFGVDNIVELDTYNQKKLTQAFKDAQNRGGFNVIIARHPCMLKFSRLQRKKGHKIKPVMVTERCKKVYKCVSAFACPSFQLKPNGKVIVQKDLCIGDGSCLQTCPLQALTIQEGGSENE